MKVITTTDPDGTTQIAVNEDPRELQILNSPKTGGKP